MITRHRLTRTNLTVFSFEPNIFLRNTAGLRQPRLRRRGSRLILYSPPTEGASPSPSSDVPSLHQPANPAARMISLSDNRFCCLLRSWSRLSAGSAALCFLWLLLACDSTARECALVHETKRRRHKYGALVPHLPATAPHHRCTAPARERENIQSKPFKKNSQNVLNGRPVKAGRFTRSTEIHVYVYIIQGQTRELSSPCG